ncbi:MAG: hypothetical protein U5L96_20915 [Owenweeksia sp.]|nr:hypothetical protein [Owenweeksia sp.]
MAELAQDMAYQNSFSFELMAGITFGKGWQIAAHLHNVKLSSTGVFTLRVADPTNPTGTFNNLEQIDINGEETRSAH